MQPGPYEKVPLTDDEKDMLLMVYHKRRKFLFTVYAVLISLAFFYSYRGIDTRSRYSGKVTRWEEKDDAKYISRFGMWMINLSFLELIVIGTGTVFWFKRVYPLKHDADSGLKEKVPYMIMRKEYFPLTNQFYVALDDPDYLHHEIDEDTYYSCAEGGFIYVYRGAKSKFVFEDNGRFTIL